MSEHVWARVGHGRTRRMTREQAEAEGLEIDTRPPMGSAAANIVRLHADPKEKEQFYNATGRRIDDRGDIKRVFKQTGLRDAEKGEEAYDRWDAHLAFANGDKRALDKFGPESIDLRGDRAREEAQMQKWRDPSYIRERFEANRQKWGSRMGPPPGR